MNLAEFLTAAYESRTGKSKGSPIATFAYELANDPALRQSVNAKLAELSDTVVAKCFCSKVHRDALQQALSMTF